MSQCGKLIHADFVYAYYTAADRQVTVVADVFVDPFTDEPHLCPNPIATPKGTPELIVESFPRQIGGIHPPLEVKQRISFSFSAETTPKNVVVHSLGVDAPERREVPVATTPPPALAPTARVAPAAPHTESALAVPTPVPFDIVGYSASFSFEEAIQDALRQALARLPAPPRNPDVPVSLLVKSTTARIAGNARPGLFVTATVQ